MITLPSSATCWHACAQEACSNWILRACEQHLGHRDLALHRHIKLILWLNHSQQECMGPWHRSSFSKLTSIETVYRAYNWGSINIGVLSRLSEATNPTLIMVIYLGEDCTSRVYFYDVACSVGSSVG